MRSQRWCLQTCVQLLKYIRTKIPVMLLAFPLWSHTVHQRSRQCSCILSKKRGNEGKGLSHQTCLFYEDFKSFSKRPLTSFCLCYTATHRCIGDGKEVGFLASKMDGPKKKGVKKIPHKNNWKILNKWVKGALKEGKILMKVKRKNYIIRKIFFLFLLVES